MALCEQCGSISIVRARPEPTDKLVRLFTSKRPFVCRRCGWRGRRDWSDADLQALMDYGAGGAEPDPDLTVLDTDPELSRKRPRRRVRARQPRSTFDAPAEQFDLAKLGLKSGQADQGSAPIGAGQTLRRERRSVQSRRKKSRRREIVATVAATALVMFLVVLLGLTGSCSGGAGVS